MTAVRVQERASSRLDEIYRNTLSEWDEAQAERYIAGLFESFDRIDTHGAISRPVPAEFGAEGFIYRYEKHYVYWKRLTNGDIGIVAILHELMHHVVRFRDDFGL